MTTVGSKRRKGPRDPFLRRRLRRSAGDAGGATVLQQADAFARHELLAAVFLGDGEHFAVVHLDCDFDALFAGEAFFGRRAGQAAGYRADHRADGRALALADGAAGDAADRCAANGADRRLGAFELDRAHAFDDAHAHADRAARFRAFVVATAEAGGAAGNGNGGQQGDAQIAENAPGYVLSKFLFIY